jgi:phosphopantetheinyl transferase (holo-ACP synthase)
MTAGKEASRKAAGATFNKADISILKQKKITAFPMVAADGAFRKVDAQSKPK